MEDIDLPIEENFTKDTTRAERRKKEWRHANRRKNLLKDEAVKPLHYYSKNMPESYAMDKRKIRQQTRQIDDYEIQLEELFDLD